MNRILSKTLKQLTFYNILNRYVSRLFLLNFLKVFLAFFTIIFLVNLIDNLDNLDKQTSSFSSIFFISLLRTPDFLNSIAPSLVLFAALFTFFSLSSHSEIVIIRVAGFSMWHLVMPIAISAFICGIFWVLFYNSISISSYKLSQNVKTSGSPTVSREFIRPKNGIWFRQDNSEFAKGYIVVNSRMVYKDNIEMIDNSLWFFNDNNGFYKRIDNKSMILHENTWHASSAILNKEEVFNKEIEEIEIATNIDKEVFSEKFLNYLQDPRLFSIYKLPSTINDLNNLGLDSTKFVVQLNYLIILPLLFVAVVLLASFFGINNFRDLTASLKLTLGIAVGLFIYIATNFIKALGASKIIPIFLSTWVVVIMCLAFSTILIYRKEERN